MFEDILKPKPDVDTDIMEYEDHGFYEDDILKSDAILKNCGEHCGCDDCLEEAIKNLADQMNLDLDDDQIEDIKIEYNNQFENPNKVSNFCVQWLDMLDRKDKIALAMTRKFHREGFLGFLGKTLDYVFRT